MSTHWIEYTCRKSINLVGRFAENRNCCWKARLTKCDAVNDEYNDDENSHANYSNDHFNDKIDNNDDYNDYISNSDNHNVKDDDNDDKNVTKATISIRQRQLQHRRQQKRRW